MKQAVNKKINKLFMIDPSLQIILCRLFMIIPGKKYIFLMKLT